MKKYIIVILIGVFLILTCILIKINLNKENNINNEKIIDEEIVDDKQINEIQEIIKRGESGDGEHYDFYEEGETLIFYGDDRKYSDLYFFK